MIGRRQVSSHSVAACRRREEATLCPDSAQFVRDLDGGTWPFVVRANRGLLSFGATCFEANSFKILTIEY